MHRPWDSTVLRLLAGIAAWAVLPLAASRIDAAEPVPPELAALIDPILTPKVEAVPEAENAIPLLIAASNAVTAPPCDFPELPGDKPAMAVSERRERIAKWLDENQLALKTFQEAAGRQRGAFPDCDWSELLNRGWPMCTLFCLVREHALDLAVHGKNDEAIALSRSMLKAAALLKGAGGTWLVFVSAGASERVTTGLMCRLARDFAIDGALLRQLVDDLDEPHDAWKAGLRRSTQAEFSQYALPPLLRIKGTDAGAVVRFAVQGWGEELTPTTTDEKLEARLKQIEQLFKGHPRPFDLADTVRRASDRFSATIRNIDRHWPEERLGCSESSFEELSAWPAALDVAVFGATGDSEVPGLSDAEIATAREKLRSVDNPIGKRILDLLTDHADVCVAARRFEASRQGARLMLAATLYLRRTGKLPPTLDELINAKVVEKIPWDPLSQSPYTYLLAEGKLIRPSATDDERSEPSCADWAYWVLPAAEKAGK